MAKFLIIVGTVNGHALAAAQGAEALLTKLGHDVDTQLEVGPQDLVRDQQEIFLICCSTTDKGQMPLNVYPLYQALDNQAVDLAGRRYGFIALGDSYFPPSQFAMGGITLENAFYSCGAKRVGDIGILDAQHVQNHSLASALWVHEWLKKLEPVAETA